MKTEKREFIQFLVDSGCLKFGDFQLKSGDRSPFFVNLGQADSGAKLDVLGRALAEAVAAIEGAFRARAAGIVVAVDRRRRATPLPAGLPPVRAVIDLGDLCDYLDETGDAIHGQALRRFYEGE